MDEVNIQPDEIQSEPVMQKPALPAADPASEKPVTQTHQHKSLLTLNIIGLAGLVLLYVLFFTSGNRRSSLSMDHTMGKAISGNIKVAFVNNDSILEHYDLVTKMRADLESKTKRLENEIASRQKAFEKDAAYFQDAVQKKSISEQSAQEIYAKLQEEQQKILEMRDRYASELQQNEMTMNVALLDSVMNFLNRYNQKYRFDYILGFTKGGNILYANDTLDITKDVIIELNKSYHSNLSK